MPYLIYLVYIAGYLRWQAGEELVGLPVVEADLRVLHRCNNHPFLTFISVALVVIYSSVILPFFSFATLLN